MHISSSSRLTVYHDGQFWVGLCEQQDKTGYSACRTVFGAEPSDEEVLRLVTVDWEHLKFSPTRPGSVESPASNPKRRQREAARQMTMPALSTKAQMALAEQREATKTERKATSKERRDHDEKERFERRREKRKQKHRGH